MGKAEAKKIVSELRKMGQDAEVNNAYRGRGSFGKETTAISCDSLIDFGRAMERAGVDIIPGYESLGLGYVVW